MRSRRSRFSVRAHSQRARAEDRGGTFTPKFYSVTAAGCCLNRTAKNHGGVQVGWLDAGMGSSSRSRARWPSRSVSLLAARGKVPEFAMA